ncbi:MAG: hypothetical protein IJ729_01390, partial [Alloprevotella sp.]|nr:hypothetical protein [Alloprevotella sp.]
MKKTLLMLIAVAGITSFASCGNKNETAPNGGADSTAVATDTTQNAPEAQPVALADIVAKAKAEGANWSVDEWKE